MDYISQINSVDTIVSDINKMAEDKSFNENEEINTVKHVCLNNVISKNKLRHVQIQTLEQLSNFLSATYGPMSSTTQIITGNNKETILSNYSKDGLKVLKHIIFDQPLEMAIQSEIEDVARYVEKRVGDGTTSSVIISAEIFKELSNVEKIYSNVPPRKLIKIFNSIVDDIKDRIYKNKRDITLEDIYNICMISTNGNEVVSRQIEDLYKEYGFDVNIDVGVSNDQDSKIRIYDGLTINEGYSDPAYINNNLSNSCDIHNARVYAFKDSVDTPEMIGFMEKILLDNIFERASSQEDMIPTVIITPRLSVDASGLLTKLVTLLYGYNKDNMQNQKPPVLIITNINGTDTALYNDIAKLCKCKFIQKYIDPKSQQAAQEKGEAPTLETISEEWYGECELVSADSTKTKFINPKAMTDETDNTYDVLIEFLKTEIKKATDENEDIATIGLLKKRLRCLEANMIEYLVGGISVSDRDALKDLVEDAVKNCSSAAENGVGYAANFEGLKAVTDIVKEDMDSEEQKYTNLIEKHILSIIEESYIKAARILYGSAAESDIVDAIIAQSLDNKAPFNIIDIIENDIDSESICNIPKGDNVLCSINTDIEILDAISRIITLMVTANQSLVQVPALNRY